MGAGKKFGIRYETIALGEDGDMIEVRRNGSPVIESYELGYGEEIVLKRQKQ
jgi:hypothetical protein